MAVDFSRLFRTSSQARYTDERRKGLRLTLGVAIPVALMFSGINYSSGHVWLAAVQVASVILLLVPSLLLSQQDAQLPLGEYLLMAAAVLIFGALFIDGGLSETGVYWVYLYPFVAFYIMGDWRGWLWISMFGLMLLSLAGLHADGVIELPYEHERLLYFLTAFLFYVVIAAIFNMLRNHFEQKLMALVHERTAAAEEYLEELKHRMLHSPLTGLPNRGLLMERLEHLLHHARRHHEPVAVAVVNIDRITEINNTLGHQAGDLILKHVGKALQTAVRKVDAIAHIGGDEFAVAMPAIGTEKIGKVAERLLMVFRQPVEVMTTSLVISGQVGFAIFPKHATSAEELLLRADIALRLAKHEQLPHKLYDASIDPFNLRRLELYRDLKRALDNDSLEMYYQPQVEPGRGRVVSAEALMRWNHPLEGFVSPDEFIQLAEQTGLISRLTRWALKRAIKQCAQWQQAGGSEIGVAVNLTPRCLLQEDLLDYISKQLAKSGLDEQSLTVEVTESLFMEQSERAIAVLSELRALGINVSIDDFGTGYSSLSYLKHLPVNELKVDQTFIKPMAESHSDYMIVESVVALSRAFGFEIVAEGVEDEITAKLLQKLGVERLQGYYFARPMPFWQFCEHINAQMWEGEN